MYLPGENLFRRRCAIDTVRLDTNHDSASDLEVTVRIQTYNSCLIRLCHVREYHIHHTHQHSIFERMSCIFDNGDNVGAVGGHVDQVTAGAVGELNCKDYSLGTYYVRNVADGGSGGCT